LKSNSVAQFTLRFFSFFTAAVLCLNPAIHAAEVRQDTNALKVYEIVPAGKSLLTNSQFWLIDDFNSGKFLNRRGAAWRVKGPNGALDLSLDKDDARSQHRGYSMKAEFHILPGEKAVFQSFLERADVSKARILALKVKLTNAKEKTFSGKFRVALTDWRHKTVVQDVTAHFPKKDQGWGNVFIPLARFKGLDFDQLFSIEFQIQAEQKPIAGNVWVDEIAFFGFNDIGFESLRDNLAGFPRVLYDVERRQQLVKMKDKELLREIARDTWKYFENARDKKTSLIVDHIRTGDSSLAADYTSPTNIALDILSIISAMDLELISGQEAENRIAKIFATLRQMRRYKGFFYNFYDTKKLSVTREYISSVDSAWLDAAFIVVRQTFKGKLADQATEFLKSHSYQEFLDPENNQLMIGIELPPNPEKPVHHYGMLVSEARIASYIAIGKGDVPRDHWWSLYRTPPDAWKWQSQKPKGFNRSTPDGMDYFQGHYEHQGKKFLPSWGGSLFEYLMPTLVLNEKKMAPEGLGLNGIVATELHRDYALKDKKYPVWGISPAATSDGRRWSYREYGVKALSAKGYPDHGVITPHVTFLALETAPKDAIKNIRALLEFNMYGEYGLYDTLNLQQKRANPQYLALDQGMTLVALCNYLKKGSIQNRFRKDEISKGAEDLLKESFFKR
jgi:hypothetical protein